MDTLNEVIVTSLDNAVQDLFVTMIGLDVMRGDVTQDRTCIQKDITAMIGLAGEYRGMIAVCFPKTTALRVVSGMLGMEISEIDSDTKDAIGEVANMIIGGAKNELYANDMRCEISTPTVVVGSSYRMYTGRTQVHTVVPFSSGEEKFYISFYVEKANR